jgi:hypothetical protein
VHDSLAVVVEGPACAEALHVGEVPRRRGGDDLVAGGDGELNGIAADARRAAPDELIDDTVAHAQPGDAFPDLDDLAREVGAEDEGVLDPGEHAVAEELLRAIDDVDRHRAFSAGPSPQSPPSDRTTRSAASHQRRSFKPSAQGDSSPRPGKAAPCDPR